MERSSADRLEPYSVGFLQQAATELVGRLKTMATVLSLDRGRTLFSQGDSSDALFVLVEGALEVSVLAEDGRKLTMNVLYPGEVFGEIGLFDGHLRREIKQGKMMHWRVLPRPPV